VGEGKKALRVDPQKAIEFPHKIPDCKTVNGLNIRQAYTAFVAARTRRHHAAEAEPQAGRVCVSDCDPYTGGTDSTPDRTIYLTGYMRSDSHVLPQLLPGESFIPFNDNIYVDAERSLDNAACSCSGVQLLTAMTFSRWSEHSAGRDSTYFVRDHEFNYSILSNEPSTGVRARPSGE
jgi:hypothetical protein